MPKSSKRVKQRFFEVAGSAFADGPVTIDSSCDSVFVGGEFSGPVGTGFNGQPVELPNSTQDMFVARLNHCGVQKYLKTAGGETTNIVYSIKQLNDNLYIGGSVDGTVIFDFAGATHAGNILNQAVFAKLNKCGDQKFFELAGINSATVKIVNHEKHLYALGIASGSTTDFAGNAFNSFAAEDIFVAAFNTCGTQQWFRHFGDSNSIGDNPLLSSVANKYGVFLSGEIEGTNPTDFNGTPVPLFGNNDVFVAGLNPSGDQRFFLTAGSLGFDLNVSLAGFGKNLYTVGEIAGPTASDFAGNLLTLPVGSNGYLAKINVCGEQKFFKTVHGSDITNPAGTVVGNVAVNEENIFVVGKISGLAGTDFNGKALAFDQNINIFVAGLTHNGCQKFFSSMGGDINNFVDMKLSDSGIYIAGYVSGTGSNVTDFCGNVITVPPENSALIFVAKLDFCGHQKFFVTAGGISNNTITGLSPTITIQDNKIFIASYIDDSSTVDYRGCPILQHFGDMDISVARLDDLTANSSKIFRSKIPFF